MNIVEPTDLMSKATIFRLTRRKGHKYAFGAGKNPHLAGEGAAPRLTEGMFLTLAGWTVANGS